MPRRPDLAGVRRRAGRSRRDRGGDVDGDGIPEVAVGAPGAVGPAGSGAGRVGILSAQGERLGSIPGGIAGGLFGSSLAAGPDANGDGFPDLLVGAPLAAMPAGPEAGAAYLFSGDGTLLAQFGGDAAGDRLGRRVLLTDDLNGDGLADLLLGAPYAEDLGRTRIVFPSVDADGDGLDGAHDNCPAAVNPDQADGDTDGVGDACDRCPALSDPGQEDADDDGRGDACDCAPLDPGAATAPGAVTGLTLGLSVNLESLLAWAPDGPAGTTTAAYDVVSGALATLQGGGGLSDATCVAADAAQPSAAVFEQLAPGAGRWYLVRAKNVCAVGGYDSGGSSQATSRDPAIAAAPAACAT